MTEILCTNEDGRLADYRVIVYVSSDKPSHLTVCKPCYNEMQSQYKTMPCVMRIERPAESDLETNDTPDSSAG